jgi:hypothetical protein
MPFTMEMRRDVDRIRDYLFGGGYPDPVSNVHRSGAMPRNAPHEICDHAPRTHASRFACATKADFRFMPSTDGKWLHIFLSRRERSQGAAHRSGIFGDNTQISLCRGVGRVAVLLQVVQRADRNVKLRREFFLRELERPANDLHLRRARHAREVRISERTVIGIKCFAHGRTADKVALRGYFAVHGLIKATPQSAKSSTFRVAKLAPRDRAMAAI